MWIESGLYSLWYHAGYGFHLGRIVVVNRKRQKWKQTERNTTIIKGVWANGSYYFRIGGGSRILFRGIIIGL
jgi:hypothetical protein